MVASGISLEQRPHVAEMGDRDADLADLAAGELVVRVVAGLGRQIEGDGKAGLALGEVAAVERVRLRRRRVARHRSGRSRACPARGSAWSGRSRSRMLQCGMVQLRPGSARGHRRTGPRPSLPDRRGRTPEPTMAAARTTRSGRHRLAPASRIPASRRRAGTKGRTGGPGPSSGPVPPRRLSDHEEVGGGQLQVLGEDGDLHQCGGAGAVLAEAAKQPVVAGATLHRRCPPAPPPYVAAQQRHGKLTPARRSGRWRCRR